MGRQWTLAVAVVAVAVLCGSADAGRATTMRGQLALSFSVDDRGVSYYSSSTHELRLELTLARNGSVKLRVRGHVQRRAGFVSPAPGQSTMESSKVEVDDRWVGRTKRARGVTTVKLQLVTKDRDRDPLTFELACKRTFEPLGGAASPSRVALQRCTPTTTYTDLPWSDPLPHYARVPLAFAERGDVLLLVVADHDSVSVEPPHAASPK